MAYPRALPPRKPTTASTTRSMTCPCGTGRRLDDESCDDRRRHEGTEGLRSRPSHDSTTDGDGHAMPAATSTRGWRCPGKAWR
jgi:hypothetical protein